MMNLKDCFMLSSYNLLHRKKYTIRMIINILFICVIITVLLLILIGVTNAYNNILYGSASNNYIYTYLSVDENGKFVPDEQYELFKDACVLEYTDSPIIRSDYNLPKVIGNEQWLFVNMKYVTANIDGHEYQGVNDYSYDFIHKYYTTERRQNIQYRSKYKFPNRNLAHFCKMK